MLKRVLVCGIWFGKVSHPVRVRQLRRTVVKIWNRKRLHSGPNFNDGDLFFVLYGAYAVADILALPCN